MPWICFSTALLFLLRLPCFPGQNGGENEESTDIISVCEGETISITCSIKDSENEVGTYLTTSIQPVNVVYVSKQNTSYILPALANRTKYSKEGSNLRITLHNVQESDSNIYQCSTYVKTKSYHKKLFGKTTIVVVKGQFDNNWEVGAMQGFQAGHQWIKGCKRHGIVEQAPLYVNPQQGQSVSITCALKTSHEDEGIYLLKTHMQPEPVLYVSSQNTSTVFPAFANRLEYSKEGEKIMVTLHNLWRNDSDIYVCAGVVRNSSFLSVHRSGTMMLIKEGEQTDCRKSSWLIYVLITVVALLFSVLMCCTLYRADMKKYFQNNPPNTVYEDMSYSVRQHTLQRTNAYCMDN